MIQMRIQRAARNKAWASGLLLAALLATMLLAAKPAHAADFAVNSTGDSGDQSIGNGFCNTTDFPVGTEPECTLRAAVEEANATTTADTISFNLGGSGVKTISPMTALPDITAPVTIDGYSEPGASPNTRAIGTDAVLKIELSGANAAAGTIGLRITDRDSVVKGLIINRFGYGVIIDGTGLPVVGNNKIEGNYIGTDASGIQDLGNSSDGVVIEGGVGGVGMNAHDNTIGGTEAGAGGQAPGAPNVIAYNGSHGVAISGNAFANSILSNSIYSNGSLGIDLRANGVTANDPGDADTGPNTLQNYPVITSVTTSSGQTTLKGTLNSTPNSSLFFLQFFSSPTADPFGFGEGRTLVGQTLVNTDASGDASFEFATATPLARGQVVSATATRNGHTSEFSRAVPVALGASSPRARSISPTAPSPATRRPTAGASGSRAAPPTSRTARSAATRPPRPAAASSPATTPA